MTCIWHVQNMGKFLTDEATAFVGIPSIVRGHPTETKGANLDNPLSPGCQLIKADIEILHNTPF